MATPRKPKSEHRPPGKKPWIPTDEILEKIRKFASLGLSEAQVAGNLGIRAETFYRKKQVYPQIDQYYVKGREEGVAYVTSKLMEKISRGDTSSTQFYLKCKGGWKDKEPDVIVNTGPQINITDSEANKQLIDVDPFGRWETYETIRQRALPAGQHDRTTEDGEED